ncbi:MAG: luxQ 8 [Gemmatimonadetes bacterium]|jgi:PAS domain S-box-containing protein|nr:luxQ 8 [Gemmatimonadota bacterium]
MTSSAPSVRSATSADCLFDGPGEVRALCRQVDWSATALGPVTGWSQSLRTIVATMLASRHPMFLWWGPELVQLYNDAYRPSLGEGGRHPRALGVRGADFWTDIWHIIGPEIAGVMSRGESTWHEDQLVPILRNGRVEEVYWTYGYSPAFDDDGSIGGTLVVCQETTTRVVAQRELTYVNEALELERSRLAQVFRDAPGFMAAIRGPDHVIEFANEAYYRMVGRRDLIGRPVREALAELAPQGFIGLLDQVLQSGVPFVGVEASVHLVRVPGGLPEERFVDFVYEPLVEVNGTRSGIIVHGSDVTEHVRARWEVERLLAESEHSRQVLAEREAERERLVAALESSADFIGLATPEGMGMYVNQAGRAMCGIASLDAVRALRITDFFPPEDLPFIEDVVMPALQRGRWRGELRFRHLVTGADIPVLYDAFQVTDPASGALIGYATVTRDLTERDRLVGEANAARAEAEAANRAKDDFLALVSHELRSPLAGIASNVQLIEMGMCGPVNDRQRRALDRVTRSQEHLRTLIDQLLDLKRIEAGKMLYEVEPVLVHDAIEDAATLVESQYEHRHLTLVRPPAGGDAAAVAVLADPGRLRQILLNLLSNAAKFTHQGGTVSLCCRVQGDRVQLEVCDDGIGIPAEQLEAVFQPFVQVRDGRQPVITGTGLGLAISRDLARGMGGDITVLSEVGKGTTFIVELPVA